MKNILLTNGRHNRTFTPIKAGVDVRLFYWIGIHYGFSLVVVQGKQRVQSDIGIQLCHTRRKWEIHVVERLRGVRRIEWGRK